MIILTIVRHGESTDNLRPVWAGWADAPLSQHGMNQAKLLGESLSDYRVDQIFASPLLRAAWTVSRRRPFLSVRKSYLNLLPNRLLSGTTNTTRSTGAKTSYHLQSSVSGTTFWEGGTTAIR